MAKLTVVQDQPLASDDRLIDPKAIWMMIRRRWRPIVASILGVVLVATLLYLNSEPQYTATGRVALDRRTEQLVDTTAGQRPMSTDSSSVETEVQVLSSPAIAAAVADRLKLADVPGFGLPDDAPAGNGSRERAIQVVQGGLDVQREGTSYAISVNFSSGDPEMAARVVNAAIDAYTSGQKTSEYSQRAEEIGLLRDRLGVLRADVIRADQALASHRGATNLIDVSQDSAAAQASMQALNTQLAQAKAEEAAASARAAAAASTTDASVNALREQQANLRARRAELARRYDSSYPTVVAVNEQLAVIDQALNSEIARARASAMAEANAARNRAASLRGSVSQSQSQLMAANSASVSMGELERNAAAAKSIYQALLDEYKQKIVALGTERSKAYVIAHAGAPGSPSSPNPLTFIIGALVGGLILAGFVAVTLETMEAGVLSQAMGEEKLGLPVVGSIPDIATVKDNPLKDGSPGTIADSMVAHPTGVFAEAFRNVLTAVKLSDQGQHARTIAITSALTDEGKTTSAICLARAAATAGTQVILVDCDLRHRTATETLAPDGDVGLIEVLQNRAQLEQAVVVDKATGAHFLPVAGSSTLKSELLTSRAMRELLARLRASYDLVLLETAPVLPVAETRAIAAMADATMLVVRWRKTPIETARKALSQLDRVGAKMLGTLLCRVSLRSSIAASVGEEVYYYPSARPKAA